MGILIFVLFFCFINKCVKEDHKTPKTVNKSRPNVKKAKTWLCKQTPLGVKGAEHFDWVKHDQIYSAILEEWPSMRHNVFLDGDGSCERSYFIGGGSRFASSQLIKGRGWHHERLLNYI